MFKPTDHKPSRRPQSESERLAAGKTRPEPPKMALLKLMLPLLMCVAVGPDRAETGIAPTIDYSHNMRVLKLPKSTRPGEIIYRLRASDADPNDRLHFGVVGAQGRALLDIVPTPGSWKEADVYLRHQLEMPLDLEGVETASSQQQQQHNRFQAPDQLLASATQLDDPLYTAIYNLTIFVADAGNKTTRVESTLLITNDDLLEQPADEAGADQQDGNNYEPAHSGGGDPLEQTRLLQQAGSSSPFELSQRQPANSSLVMKLNLPGLSARPASRHQQQQPVQLSPFIRPRHVFTVSESGQPGESIGFLTVRESDKSHLPVSFELRGQGADHFGIRYVFGPRGQSRAELVLSQPVDYERQNLFKLKVLALNAWTNTKFDTRNVATLDLVVVVADVQDTPPHFRQLPPALLISSQMRPGDLVARFEAEDGDFGDQRPIGYALDAGSPLSSFFTIDKLGGELRLARPWQEISLQQQSLMMRLAGAAAATAASATTAAAPNRSGLTQTPPPPPPPPLSAPWLMQLSVFASELPDASSYDHLWPPMFARADLPVQLVDLVNEPPKLLGGLLTETSDASSSPNGRLTVATLRAFIAEFSNRDEPPTQSELRHSARPDGWPSGQLVQWYTSKNYTGEAAVSSASSLNQPASGQEFLSQLVRNSRGRPILVDFGQGSNGTFELSLEGPDAHLFELEPSHPVNKLTLFNLFVAHGVNRSLFDFDSGPNFGNGLASGHQEQPMRSFHVDVVARDFGLAHRETLRVKCLIDLLDINDNAPQFDLDLYTFSIFENAQVGQILGSIRARDMDKLGGIAGVLSNQYQRVRYTSLTGRDSNLFRLDPDTGLITLEGALDRERQDHFLLLAEARDLSGQMANYTKILINVLDVNDNAPLFGQSHYDAVLLPDGTFHQPLVVAASDADEPSSANSQVAYEIIAGNQNDQFAIDALSGAIYPTGNTASAENSATSPSRTHIQIPSILSEPILPFIRTNNQQQPDQHGRILPSPGARDKHQHHEVEETTVPTTTAYKQSPLRLNWPRSAPADTTAASSSQPPPTESRFAADKPKLHQQQQQQHFDASKVAPVTTLVIRAHDFGIPLRSATCKVTIYNQALLSRSLSVILNGTAEQLEQRRDLIERSFGALTGSRVQIESIDALSDSSSISVARLKLAIPAGHSLIDLTDLSALMTALDYKPTGCQLQQPANQQQSLNEFRHQPIHYITTGDRIYPVHGAPISGNISATGGGSSSSTSTTNTAIFTEFSPLDQAASQLERRLLFYIIIVGICILALLVIWMIYFCCREDQTRQMKSFQSYESSTKGRHRANRSVATGSFAADSSESIETGARKNGANTKESRHFGRATAAKSSSRMHLMDDQDQQQQQQLQHPMARSASQLVLNDEQGQLHGTSNKTLAKTTITSGQHPIGNNLLKQHQQQMSLLSTLKPEHLSMYNGQVWFEQGGPMRPANSSTGLGRLGERRASSAPSASGRSLDSGLQAIIGGRASGRMSAVSPINSGIATPQQRRGQFFPNTLGYARNLASIGTTASNALVYPGEEGGGTGQRFRSRGRVVPISMLGRPIDAAGFANEAFEGGGLVMVPFVAGQQQPASTDTKQRNKTSTRAKSTHHQRHRSKSTSSSSGSRTDSTRTLDEEDELDHESVLLDSDQELLGFDSTGTPIIATRTRQQPVAQPAGASYLLAPPEGASEQNGGGTGTSSPAATVINMSQGAKTSPANKVVEKREETQAKKVAARGTEGDKKAKASAESKEDSGTNADKARQTMDLMSELNERLNSANKQRALKRQASGEGQGQQQQQRADATHRQDSTKQVIDQATRDDTRQSLPRLQAESKPAASDTKSSVPATGESSDKANKMSQQTSGLATSAGADDEAKRKQAAFAGRRASETMSYQSRSTVSEATTSETVAAGGDADSRLKDMKNGELLEKQSIFALTYNQLATDRLPS